MNEDVAKDRDEWKQQHENALACWRHESAMWQSRLAALRVAATDAANVLGELDDDGGFSPCPQPSLSGAIRDEIAPWVEAPWRALWMALDEQPWENAARLNGDTQAKQARAWEGLYNERNRLWREAEDRLDAVRLLLETNGCDCDCDHGAEEHDDVCERCFACDVAGAIERTGAPRRASGASRIQTSTAEPDRTSTAPPRQAEAGRSGSGS